MPPRAFRSRPPVAIAPVAISTMTCMATIGWDARRYRERVLPLCPSAYRSGTIAGAPTDEVLHALASLAVDATELELDDEGDADDQPRDEAAVLARLGLRKVAGASR